MQNFVKIVTPTVGVFNQYGVEFLYMYKEKKIFFKNLLKSHFAKNPVICEKASSE